MDSTIVNGSKNEANTTVQVGGKEEALSLASEAATKDVAASPEDIKAEAKEEGKPTVAEGLNPIVASPEDTEVKAAIAERRLQAFERYKRTSSETIQALREDNHELKRLRSTCVSMAMERDDMKNEAKKMRSGMLQLEKQHASCMLRIKHLEQDNSRLQKALNMAQGPAQAYHREHAKDFSDDDLGADDYNDVKEVQRGPMEEQRTEKNIANLPSTDPPLGRLVVELAKMASGDANRTSCIDEVHELKNDKAKDVVKSKTEKNDAPSPRIDSEGVKVEKNEQDADVLNENEEGEEHAVTSKNKGKGKSKKLANK